MSGWKNSPAVSRLCPFPETNRYAGEYIRLTLEDKVGDALYLNGLLRFEHMWEPEVRGKFKAKGPFDRVAWAKGVKNHPLKSFEPVCLGGERSSQPIRDVVGDRALSVLRALDNFCEEDLDSEIGPLIHLVDCFQKSECLELDDRGVCDFLESMVVNGYLADNKTW